MFFQAEDGIRDLVRSRGLGDVYKRQGSISIPNPYYPELKSTFYDWKAHGYVDMREAIAAVSYTHLTLPTSDLV